MREFICDASEFLKFSRALCCLISAALIILLLIAGYIDIYIDDPGSDPIRLLAPIVQGSPSLRSPLSWAAEIIVTLGFGILFLMIGYIFSACPQRIAVIDALLLGYVRNFLAVINAERMPLIIVKPGHEIVKTGQTSGLQLLTDQKWVNSLMDQFNDGFSINVETVANRTVHVARHTDAPNNAVMLDFSRNLVSLKNIAEAEGQTWIDRICHTERKYTILRDKYFEKLEKETEALPNPHRVKFVDGKQIKNVVNQIKRDLEI